MKNLTDSLATIADSLGNNPKITATVAGTGAVLSTASTLQAVGSWVAILAGGFSILVSIKKLFKK